MAKEILIGFANALKLGEDGWAQIAPFGDHPGMALVDDGMGGQKKVPAIQRINASTAGQMVAEFREATRGPKKFLAGRPIYKGHPDVPGMEFRYPDKNPKGVFAALEIRDDGFYGQPVLTPEGTQLVQSGEANRLSGRWSAEPTGEKDAMGREIFAPTVLISAGLTNTPNLPVQMMNEAEVPNAGTSEGARKGWIHRPRHTAIGSALHSAGLKQWHSALMAHEYGDSKPAATEEAEWGGELALEHAAEKHTDDISAHAWHLSELAKGGGNHEDAEDMHRIAAEVSELSSAPPKTAAKHRQAAEEHGKAAEAHYQARFANSHVKLHTRQTKAGPVRVSGYDRNSYYYVGRNIVTKVNKKTKQEKRVTVEARPYAVKDGEGNLVSTWETKPEAHSDAAERMHAAADSLKHTGDHAGESELRSIALEHEEKAGGKPQASHRRQVRQAEHVEQYLHKETPVHSGWLEHKAEALRLGVIKTGQSTTSAHSPLKASQTDYATTAGLTHGKGGKSVPVAEHAAQWVVETGKTGGVLRALMLAHGWKRSKEGGFAKPSGNTTLRAVFATEEAKKQGLLTVAPEGQRKVIAQATSVPAPPKKTSVLAHNVVKIVKPAYRATADEVRAAGLDPKTVGYNVPIHIGYSAKVITVDPGGGQTLYEAKQFKTGERLGAYAWAMQKAPTHISKLANDGAMLGEAHYVRPVRATKPTA